MIIKELNFLSLPDYFNKNLLNNYNQKFDGKNFLDLSFQLTNNKNLGLAVKALLILELIFPKKAHVISLKIKMKKSFNEKNTNVILYFFHLNLNGYEFLELYRFLGLKPLNLYKKEKLDKFPMITRKLKMFDFNFQLKVIPSGCNKSFEFLKAYHID